MIDQGSVTSLMGSTVRDSAGDKIGKVGQVYLDDTTGQPEWVTVRTGLFGTRESFVPLAAARVEGDELVVDVTKQRVTDAPQVDEDGHLSEEQEAELYAYYGVRPGAFGRDVGPTDSAYADPLEDGYAEPAAGAMDSSAGPGVGTLEAPPGHVPGGIADDDSGATPEVAYGPGTSYPGTAATSHAGPPAGSAGDDATARSEAGRARLRKYVVTETEQAGEVREERIDLDDPGTPDRDRR